MYSIVDKVFKRITNKGRGSVFTIRDFEDIATRTAVRQSLSRLSRRGLIRRIGQGIYEYPRKNPRFGVLSSDPDAVANALARKNGAILQVSGARATNMLGLSTQV